MTAQKSQRTSDDQPAAKKVDLALLTARTLSAHMARIGQGKNAAELDEAIKAAEPKPEAE